MKNYSKFLKHKSLLNLIHWCFIIFAGDCYDKKCSGHGICQNAQCICDIGWIGRNCERRNSVLMQCLPDCSSHGDFNVESGKCNCHDHWTGRECNISKFYVLSKNYY